MRLEENLIKIVKFVDYCYLQNFIKNTLNDNYEYNNLYELNEWKIFSNNLFNEKKNILNFLTIIKNLKYFSINIILLTINIFKKICIKYAHLIENYTLLFGCIYTCITKINSDNYINYNFLYNYLKIDNNYIKNICDIVNKFIDCNDIFMSNEDKINLMTVILYN